MDLFVRLQQMRLVESRGGQDQPPIAIFRQNRQERYHGLDSSRIESRKRIASNIDVWTYQCRLIHGSTPFFFLEIAFKITSASALVITDE